MNIKDVIDNLELRVKNAVQNYYEHESIRSLEFDMELIQKDVEHVQVMIKIKQRQDAELR